ncbi:MAG: 6-hydroxymethylpterin diphosphokinase MptE-like protein [Candidatus Micrarchaeia archaeon]
MQLNEWMREYERIKRRLAHLGLNFDGDRMARDALARLVRGRKGWLAFLRGKPAIVFGNARKNKTALVHPCAVIAADGASEMLLKEGIVPDVVCTDLDGRMEAIREAGEKGAVIVIHAHGDNISKLEDAVRMLRGCKLIGTTQVEPKGRVYNFGGFTDGDRCIFLARAFGASPIGFVGIDFRSAKHGVARRLIGLLRRERADIFNLATRRGRREFVRWVRGS